MAVRLTVMREYMTEVDIGDRISLLFSYTTIVAFRTNRVGWRITDQLHSRTTSRHLNERFGKPFRTEHTIPTAQFDLELALLTDRLDDAVADLALPEPQEDPT